MSSVRVCGHQLRLKKTIKPYTFFKSAAGLIVLSVLLVAPAYAADAPRSLTQQASSASVSSPCLPSKVSGMDKKVSRDTTLPQTQRTAGSPSAAMILAMALGVRNISGPMEQANVSQRTAKPCLTQKSGTSRIAMER